MGYDLHIARTKDWTQAASAPITRHDVDALIAADAELVWSATDYVDMRDAAGQVTRYWMIAWRGQPCFWWYRDQIQCSGPDEAQVSKLVQMARALNAYAVGDDGEIYPLESQAAPPAPESDAPPTARWPLWKQLLLAFLVGCVLLAVKLLIFGG
jgi:hypothetical protein